MKIALAALLLVSACATVTSESTQEIHVTTEPEGAACTLSNGMGSTQIEQTPGSAEVHRSFTRLIVSCGTDGGLSASQTIEGKTRGRAYGNLLLLGLPATVDAATGYGYEYEPGSIHLKLSQQ